MVFHKDTKLSVFILLSIVGLGCGKHIMCISICRSCVKSKKKTIHSFISHQHTTSDVSTSYLGIKSGDACFLYLGYSAVS